MTTAIEVQGLSKSFHPGALALDNVSLRVADGEMVALLGACLLYTSDAADE